MFDLIKRKKILIILALALVVAVVVVVKIINANGSVETTSPVLGDLVRTVKVSGKVIPQESVDLSFETSGTISVVAKEVGDRVRRGDLIVRIDTSGINSNILKAEAELALAQAELDKLDGAGVFEAQIAGAKQALVQTIIDAYTASDDAVYNKTDQFFLNPNSNRPAIAPTFVGYSDLRNSIDKNRVLIGETLISWGSLIQNLNTSTYTEEHLAQSKKYLAQVSAYIADVARAASLFEASSSFSQTTLDSYKADTVTARNNLNSASQKLISAEDVLKRLLLEVPVQIARVEAAQATLANYRSQLAKSSLTSPINGVVSKQEAKIGQVVSSASNVVSIISEGFEIEAFIPEVLIAGVEIDNTATVTLDAYGSEEFFEAKVVHIDPAETIRDGVSTYKVKFAFNSPDGRIRSGMTANINIETFRKEVVTLIPERTVFREEGETFVYLLKEDGSQEKTPVEVGERDSSGSVELISDISYESKLIINPKNK